MGKERPRCVACSDGTGGSYVTIPIKVCGFNAQKNYLSSPSNQYITNSNTVSPTQTNNFCTSSAGTITGCATSGLRTIHRFVLGWPAKNNPGHGVSCTPIISPAFTAHYGAVQWLGFDLLDDAALVGFTLEQQQREFPQFGSK
jgi:hypothetical protein